MPEVGKEDSETFFTSLKSLCSGPAVPSTCSRATLQDQKLLLSVQPCPHFLLLHNAVCTPGNLSASSAPQLIILVQPYSLMVEKRLASVDSEQSCLMTSRESKRSSASDMDVAGSPLRDHFAAGLDSECVSSPFAFQVPEQHHLTGPQVATFRGAGFDASRAHSLWCVINPLVRRLSATLRLLPVFILVSGDNAQGTRLYGSGPFCGSGREAWLTSVRAVGPVPAQRVPPLDQLRQLCSGPLFEAYVDVSATATYEVVAEPRRDDGSDKRKKVRRKIAESESTTVKVECSWPRPGATVCHPPPDAHAVVNVRVGRGCMEGPAGRELRLLQGAVVGLGTHEVSWYVRAPDQPPTMDRLNQLFLQYSTAGPSEKKKTTDETAMSFDDIIAGKLTTLYSDFLDSLWTILCDSESLHDLRAGFRQVFRALATHLIRPPIHVRNTTKVGVICRSLMRGQQAEPELTGAEPILMLVELGICKIKRQLAAILQASDLATEGQLFQFLERCSVGLEDSFSHEESLEQLQRLHLVLHIISCVRTYLKLPVPVLAEHTARLLEELQRDPAPVCAKPHTFSFTTVASSIKEFLDRVSPMCWTAKLMCGSKSETLAPDSRRRAGQRVGASECAHERSLQVCITNVPLIKIVPAEDVFVDLAEVDDQVENGTQAHYLTSVTSVRDFVLS